MPAKSGLRVNAFGVGSLKEVINCPLEAGYGATVPRGKKASSKQKNTALEYVY
jgi:hypothetical protein